MESMAEKTGKSAIFWGIVGSGVIFLVSLGMMTDYQLSPISPVPIYLALGFFSIKYAVFLVLPTIHAVHVFLIADRKCGREYFIAVTTFLIIMNFVWLYFSVPYGVDWQGQLHTALVVVENVLGFLLLVYLLVKSRASDFTYLFRINFVIFFMLSWCAFPWLGETP